MNILVIGYGNPGRLDDGLGPALARRIEALGLPGVTVDSDYQLTVEDAAEVARYDAVIFADADDGGPEPFWMKRAMPAEDGLSFSSHSCRPEAVLALAGELFSSSVQGWLLGIRGYEFNEFGEGLSPHAAANLDQAAEWLGERLRRRELQELRPPAETR